MKHLDLLTSAFLLLLSFSMASSAGEPLSKPESKGMNKMGGGMGGMMGGMTEEQQDQHMRTFQEHMLLMHDLSDQILAEKDPAKKEQLKKQQLDLLKAHHDQMMEHRQQWKKDHKGMMQPGSKTNQ